MKPQLTENQKKFINALRSGEYKQTQGVLHREDRFCALGVACSEAVKSGLPIEVVQRSSGSMTYDKSSLCPPYSVLNWLGAQLGSAAKIMDLNDKLNCTFEEIADELESNPEKYFA